jgi:glycosyltransferase involved in cell wall biosynthesis
MRIMIFETNYEGHRLQYVRSIIEALRELPISSILLITCKKVIDSREFGVHLADVRDEIDVDASIEVSRGSSYRASLARFFALNKAIKRHRPDHVYVPYADGLMQVSGIANMFRLCWDQQQTIAEGLLMRGRFAYHFESGFGRMKDWASLIPLSFAPFDAIHQLDPIAFKFAQNYNQSLARRCRLIPEAVEPMHPISSAAAREILGIAVEGRYLGCLGWLDARKGVDLLIRSFALAPLLASDRLLLMGHIESEIEELLQGEFAAFVASGRIVVVSGHASQEKFHLGLSAVDVICTPYPRHIGSSGIVVRAAVLEKPVLGSNSGWIGAVIQCFGLGWICDVEDTSEFSAAIGSALGLSSSYRPSEAAATFAHFHSLENFKIHLTRLIRDRLGIAEARTVVLWEWNKPLRPYQSTTGLNPSA